MAVNFVEKIDNQVSIKNVLISVSDKRKLAPFVKGLISCIPEIRFFSTGGTFKNIQAVLGDSWKKNLSSVADYTGQPEMQGGLVKTLDFKIYLGILGEQYNSYHDQDLSRTGSIHFDMIVANLYPFQETIREENSTIEKARANIDIGGPCMLRASAKNYLRVVSVCDPDDYEKILQEIQEKTGKISFETRFQCAQKTFRHTACYDQAIADYLELQNSKDVLNLYTLSSEQ